MSMRPVDFQTIIPKLPEIHKSKSAENELVKNNLNINIQKEQQQYVQNTRQVVEANKAQEARINKDEKQKRGREIRRMDTRKVNLRTKIDMIKNKRNPLGSIDIRI